MGKLDYPETSPILALVFSLFLPSLGQFYNNQPFKALAALTVFNISIFSLTFTNWLLLLVWLVIIIDAVLTSNYFKRERRKVLKDYF